MESELAVDTTHVETEPELAVDTTHVDNGVRTGCRHYTRRQVSQNWLYTLLT